MSCLLSGCDGNQLRDVRFDVAPDGATIAWTLLDGASTGRPSIRMGEPAPEFPAGSSTNLASMRGAPVVVEFFSPGCGFCAEAAPELRDAAEGALAEAGIKLISIEQTDSGEGQAYAMEKGKAWPTIVGEAGAASADLYRVRAVPTYVVVDADGSMCARGNWRDVKDAVSKGEPCTAGARG